MKEFSRKKVIKTHPVLYANIGQNVQLIQLVRFVKKPVDIKQSCRGSGKKSPGGYVMYWYNHRSLPLGKMIVMSLLVIGFATSKPLILGARYE